MNLQVLSIVAIVLLILAVVFMIPIIRERNKLLANYKPLKSKYDKLSEDYDRLKLKAEELPENHTAKSDKKSQDKGGKKSVKKQESHDSPVVSELNEKIKSLKADNSKLKERNYNLSKDNESLRQDIRSRATSNEQEQRELVTLREAKVDLTASLDAAKSQIAALEKELSELKSNDVVVKDEAKDQDSALSDDEKCQDLMRENASLQASLKDVRGELANFKRDFKAQLDVAKTEVADSNRSVRKELSAAQRLILQTKTRADNNHKIYLIARAQMLLVEKRLIKLDPNYKPIVALPTSNEAIDEVVKKFVTFDARENLASRDILHKSQAIDELNDKVKTLESENAALKASQSATSGVSDVFGFTGDDSLSDLVNKFSLPGPDALNVDSLDGNGDGEKTASRIDFAKLDDDWDLL